MQPRLFNLLPSETAPQSVFVFWKVGAFKEIYFCHSDKPTNILQKCPSILAYLIPTVMMDLLGCLFD